MADYHGNATAKIQNKCEQTLVEDRNTGPQSLDIKIISKVTIIRGWEKMQTTIKTFYHQSSWRSFRTLVTHQSSSAPHLVDFTLQYRGTKVIQVIDSVFIEYL